MLWEFDPEDDEVFNQWRCPSLMIVLYDDTVTGDQEEAELEAGPEDIKEWPGDYVRVDGRDVRGSVFIVGPNTILRTLDATNEYLATPGAEQLTRQAQAFAAMQSYDRCLEMLRQMLQEIKRRVDQEAGHVGV